MNNEDYNLSPEGADDIVMREALNGVNEQKLSAFQFWQLVQEHEAIESIIANAKRKLEFNVIHNNESGFTSDLFSIDRVYYLGGEVVYAERIFKIKAPRWLKKRVLSLKDKEFSL